MEQDIKSFDELYYNEMLPVLRKYEKFRQALFYKTILIEVTSVLGFGTFYFISEKVIQNNSLPFYNEIYPILLTIALVVALTVFVWTPIDNFKNFKSGLKKRCNSSLKKVFGDIEWNQSGINDSLIKKSQLFSEYNRIGYDDKFIGNYKKTPYSVAETNMLYIIEGKHKMVFPVFKGVIISFKSNKTIKAHTMITTKGDKSIRNYNPALWFVAVASVLGILVGFSDPSVLWIGIASVIGFVIMLVDTIIKWRKFQGVKLEDLNFDRRFSVFSKDQIEARYLITPSFMDRLNNLRTAFGTQKIKCAFFDDKIVFAISTNKDLFELGDFWHTIINRKKVKEFYDEITAIYNMIDYFKLAEKTGL